MHMDKKKKIIGKYFFSSFLKRMKYARNNQISIFFFLFKIVKVCEIYKKRNHFLARVCLKRICDLICFE